MAGGKAYRINREYACNFVPLGLFVRQPPEPLSDGPGKRVLPLDERVPIKRLSGQSAREWIPAFGERVAGIFVGCHELGDWDAVWGV